MTEHYSYETVDCAGAMMSMPQENDPDHYALEIYCCDDLGHEILLCDTDRDQAIALERARIFCCCLGREVWIREHIEWSDHEENDIIGGFEFDEDANAAVRY